MDLAVRFDGTIIYYCHCPVFSCHCLQAPAVESQHILRRSRQLFGRLFVRSMSIICDLCVVHPILLASCLPRRQRPLMHPPHCLGLMLRFDLLPSSGQHSAFASSSVVRESRRPRAPTTWLLRLSFTPFDTPAQPLSLLVTTSLHLQSRWSPDCHP